MWGWGRNHDCQLRFRHGAPGRQLFLKEPQRVMRHTICEDTDTQATYEENRVQIVQVDAGERHSVCLLADGRVLAWGNEVKGALGTQWKPSRRFSLRDNEKMTTIPVEVKLNDEHGNREHGVQIAAGGSQTMCLTENGDEFLTVLRGSATVFRCM
jgi:alpha-tubulin suppressor-like RCC1 family protein